MHAIKFDHRQKCPVACQFRPVYHWKGSYLFVALFHIKQNPTLAATYATIYTFTPELFPTVVRNMAIGVCSTMARIGAISASYIVMFLVSCELQNCFGNIKCL